MASTGGVFDADVAGGYGSEMHCYHCLSDGQCNGFVAAHENSFVYAEDCTAVGYRDRGFLARTANTRVEMRRCYGESAEPNSRPAEAQSGGVMIIHAEPEITTFITA